MDFKSMLASLWVAFFVLLAFIPGSTLNTIERKNLTKSTAAATATVPTATTAPTAPIEAIEAVEPVEATTPRIPLTVTTTTTTIETIPLEVDVNVDVDADVNADADANVDVTPTSSIINTKTNSQSVSDVREIESKTPSLLSNAINDKTIHKSPAMKGTLTTATATTTTIVEKTKTIVEAIEPFLKPKKNVLQKAIKIVNDDKTTTDAADVDVDVDADANENADVNVEVVATTATATATASTLPIRTTTRLATKNFEILLKTTSEVSETTTTKEEATTEIATTTIKENKIEEHSNIKKKEDEKEQEEQAEKKTMNASFSLKSEDLLSNPPDDSDNDKDNDNENYNDKRFDLVESTTILAKPAAITTTTTTMTTPTMTNIRKPTKDYLQKQMKQVKKITPEKASVVATPPLAVSIKVSETVGIGIPTLVIIGKRTLNNNKNNNNNDNNDEKKNINDTVIETDNVNGNNITTATTTTEAATTTTSSSTSDEVNFKYKNNINTDSWKNNIEIVAENVESSESVTTQPPPLPEPKFFHDTRQAQQNGQQHQEQTQNSQYEIDNQKWFSSINNKNRKFDALPINLNNFKMEYATTRFVCNNNNSNCNTKSNLTPTITTTTTTVDTTTNMASVGKRKFSVLTTSPPASVSVTNTTQTTIKNQLPISSIPLLPSTLTTTPTIRQKTTKKPRRIIATTTSKPRPIVDDYRTIISQAGSHAYLPCNVKQLVKKPISWLRVRDGHILTVDQTTFIADQRFQSVYSSNPEHWSLQIKYVQPKDAGTYECQVSTEPKASAIVYLHVLEPKTELVGESTRHVKAGSQVKLRCIISQALEPPLFINWFYNQKQIYLHNRKGWRTEIERIDLPPETSTSTTTSTTTTSTTTTTTTTTTATSTASTMGETIITLSTLQPAYSTSSLSTSPSVGAGISNGGNAIDIESSGNDANAAGIAQISSMPTIIALGAGEATLLESSATPLAGAGVGVGAGAATQSATHFSSSSVYGVADGVTSTVSTMLPTFMPTSAQRLPKAPMSMDTLGVGGIGMGMGMGIIPGVADVKQITAASLIIASVGKQDSGNYTCSPSNSAPRTIVLHVLNGEYSASAITSGCDATLKTRLLWQFNALTAACVVVLCLHVKSIHLRAFV